jgi:hypothetical protein
VVVAVEAQASALEHLQLAVAEDSLVVRYYDAVQMTARTQLDSAAR